MSDELNPNHPVTRAAHDHWHKIVAILLARPPYNGRTVITEEEIIKWAAKYDDCAVVMKDSDRKLTIWLVSKEEAAELARNEGGMPA